MDKHLCHVSIQTLVLYSGLPAVLPETVSGVILANFIRFSGKKMIDLKVINIQRVKKLFALQKHLDQIIVAGPTVAQLEVFFSSDYL